MKKRRFPDHKYSEAFRQMMRHWMIECPGDALMRRRVYDAKKYRLQDDIETLARRIDEDRHEAIRRIRFPYLFDGTGDGLTNRECKVVERTKNQFRLSNRFYVPRRFAGREFVE
jgi:hypothetical protein